MTTSELAEVEALLERVLPDPSGFMEKVLSQLVERLGATAPPAPPTVVEGFEATAHQDLVDHNLLVAAALGACDCWGAEPLCEVCGGAGSSGWTDPDPELFAEFVAPAVARAATRAPAAHRQTEHHHTVDAPTRDDKAGGPEEGDSDEQQRLAG